MSRIDHIGIATNNINEASKFWHEIGLDSGEDHINLEQDVKIECSMVKMKMAIKHILRLS